MLCPLPSTSKEYVETTIKATATMTSVFMSVMLSQVSRRECDVRTPRLATLYPPTHYKGKWARAVVNVGEVGESSFSRKKWRATPRLVSTSTTICLWELCRSLLAPFLEISHSSFIVSVVCLPSSFSSGSTTSTPRFLQSSLWICSRSIVNHWNVWLDFWNVLLRITPLPPALKRTTQLS